MLAAKLVPNAALFAMLITACERKVGCDWLYLRGPVCPHWIPGSVVLHASSMNSWFHAGRLAPCHTAVSDHEGAASSQACSGHMHVGSDTSCGYHKKPSSARTTLPLLPTADARALWTRRTWMWMLPLCLWRRGRSCMPGHSCSSCFPRRWWQQRRPPWPAAVQHDSGSTSACNRLKLKIPAGVFCTLHRIQNTEFHT
jgi:hypothetical protein